MPDSSLRLAIIIGSTRQGRFAPTVAAWFADHARTRTDLVVDLIDLADARLPDVLSNQPGPSVRATSQRLAAAEAFVVVTPEYNRSFPASLKNAIDWHFKEWQAKPVGFVSYGGMSGGLRAVEHLRQVFVELHAVTVRDAVSFHGVWGQTDGPETARRWIDGVFDALAAETALHAGGISGHFHISLDGTPVLNYAEWVDEASHVEALGQAGSIGRGPAWRKVQSMPGVENRGFRRYSVHGVREGSNLPPLDV